MRRFVFTLLVALAPSEQLLGQVDTIPRTNLFTWRDVAILEGFAILAVAAAPLDRKWALRLQDSLAQRNMRLRKTARIVRTVAMPGAFVIGTAMYLTGRATRNARAADLGLHGTEALLLGEGIGFVLKGTVGRARPYHDITNPHDYQLLRGFKGGATDYRSMPSGHTIAAFAAAAAVTSETSRWWPNSIWLIAPAMYGGATIAGVSRMYNNKHWASDVITGAAIGTMSGLIVVRWHFSHPGNGIDRLFLGGSIQTGGPGPASIRLNAFSLP
jgi:membrane-associated phospholipid phosphatase